jgi:hypothetical protein
MRNVCEDQEIYKYAYVFKDEAIGAFQNDKLLLIQAPSGTELIVGQPTLVSFDPVDCVRTAVFSKPTKSSTICGQNHTLDRHYFQLLTNPLRPLIHSVTQKQNGPKMNLSKWAQFLVTSWRMRTTMANVNKEWKPKNYMSLKSCAA